MSRLGLGAGCAGVSYRQTCIRVRTYEYYAFDIVSYSTLSSIEFTMTHFKRSTIMIRETCLDCQS